VFFDKQIVSVPHHSDEEQIVSIEAQIDRSPARSESSKRTPAAIDENAESAFATHTDAPEEEESEEEQTIVVQTERVIPRRPVEVPEYLRPIPLKSPPPLIDPPMVRRPAAAREPRWLRSPNAMSVSETDSTAEGSSDSF
jgi:hypothetical protein